MKPSKTIYFVRHGQSEANTLPIYHPLDTPLTEKGIDQAQKTAERVSHLEFETLIVSPLTRTQQTAHYITKATGKIPELSELFVERKKPRVLEGREHADLEAKALWDEWHETLFLKNVRVKDGENFDDVMVRIDAALELLQNHPSQNIVVVTHGWFVRALMAKILLDELLTGPLLKKSVSTTETENTGITVIQLINSKWRLWIYNDHAHLG